MGHPVVKKSLKTNHYLKGGRHFLMREIQKRICCCTPITQFEIIFHTHAHTNTNTTHKHPQQTHTHIRDFVAEHNQKKVHHQRAGKPNGENPRNNL